MLVLQPLKNCTTSKRRVKSLYRTNLKNPATSFVPGRKWTLRGVAAAENPGTLCGLADREALQKAPGCEPFWISKQGLY
jgi:hypothetical protein